MSSNKQTRGRGSARAQRGKPRCGRRGRRRSRRPAYIPPGLNRGERKTVRALLDAPAVSIDGGPLMLARSWSRVGGELMIVVYDESAHELGDGGYPVPLTDLTVEDELPSWLVAAERSGEDEDELTEGGGLS